VIVTGGASGIGEATAARFLSEGARVLILDRDRPGLAGAHERLKPVARAGDGELFTCAGDVSVAAEVGRMIVECREALGGVDVLVSNAGISYQEPFLDTPLDHWTRTLDVNLTSMFLVCQATARQMIEQNAGGAMILMSSTNGLVAEDGYAHYNASKAGVALLAKSLAVELGAHAIRANAVCPGYIVTPLAESIDDAAHMAAYAAALPLGRLGRPADVAATVAFLASSDASFITGETLVVDGGQLCKSP
jgi:NAD(P)-dependent dehydrogenase (short-subunit alcohol dehydrogenase family)